LLVARQQNGRHHFLGLVMTLNKHEQVKPNVAGLTSPVQQAEMKVILAGAWPPLKPLPVFKYGTDEYRAEIHFDSTRGEWVCGKTSLPSHKVQELRGGLTEMTMALPHGQAEDFTEAVAAEQPEQELEKDANRRLQAILAWRENYENGALYSELRDYLSESQQAEIHDSIRMTLTARQLQFNPKNVEVVFDALWKAGGRLATLMEIAQRTKAAQEADPQAPAKLATLEAERQAPVEAIHRTRDQVQTSSPELIACSEPQASEPATSEMATPEIPDANPPSSVEDLQEKPRYRAPVSGFGPQVRTGKVESSPDRIEDSSSHSRVLEISEFQVAAFVFLFVVIGFTVVLAVGRGPFGKRLRDAQKSILAVDATSPALPNRPGETTSPASTPPAANTFNSPAVNPPAPETEEPRSENPSAQSPALESEPSANPEASLERDGSTGPIARNATPLASPKPAHSPEAGGPINGAPGNPAPRRVTPATAAGPHPSPLSVILVRGPGDGSRPFRLTLREEPIAASSSFAMTSELSLLVVPEPGPAATHGPARLQPGELVSFVWPRYPRPGDRYGSSETVKVRATIGPLGQVLDIKFVQGSTSLLPATMSAIRQWRYQPTLLNGTPVQAQQDVTIEFRPPQYVSHVRTQRPSRN
jgi:TonB family protein